MVVLMHCEVRSFSKSFVPVCMMMWLGLPRSFVVRRSVADVIVGVKYWWVGVLGLKRSQSMYLPLESISMMIELMVDWLFSC